MEGSFLSQKDRSTCVALAATDSSLNGKRAAALLLLDQGGTQSEAAQEIGLTKDQVRYLTRRFKEVGMALFQGIQSAATIQAVTEDLKVEKFSETPLAAEDISDLDKALAEDTGRKLKKKKKAKNRKDKDKDKGKKEKKKEKKTKKKKRKN